LLNAGGYRSIFEAAGHKLNETGGVMLWKLNAAFPSVVWQVYDWYLEPNSGYYFMKRACEAVHIQLNLDDSAVALVNRTYIKRPNLHYEAEVVGMTGKSLFKQDGHATLDTTDVKEVLSLRDLLTRTEGVSFVLLTLKDEMGKTLSQNTYWMSPGHDFADLRAMPSATVRTTVTGTRQQGAFTEWSLQFTNTTPRLAFFLNPQLTRDGEEVLPSFWSDNYFSIPAGGSVTVRVSCPAGSTPRLRLEGWNITPTTLPLTKD
jgi:exo-1,4-beta-D-glucosaminidase